MRGAAPFPRATPSSANHSAKAAPPRASTSLAKRASRSKRRILPVLMVGSDSGLGAAEGSHPAAAKAQRTRFHETNIRFSQLGLQGHRTSVHDPQIGTHQEGHCSRALGAGCEVEDSGDTQKGS